jgi:hypothetical protein
MLILALMSLQMKLLTGRRVVPIVFDSNGRPHSPKVHPMHVFQYNKLPLLNSTLSVFKFCFCILKVRCSIFNSAMFDLKAFLDRSTKRYCSVKIDQAVEVVIILIWLSYCLNLLGDIIYQVNV